MASQDEGSRASGFGSIEGTGMSCSPLPGRSFSFSATDVDLANPPLAGDVARSSRSRLLLLAFLASTSPVLASFGPILDWPNRFVVGTFFPKSGVPRPSGLPDAERLDCDAALPGLGMLLGAECRDLWPRPCAFFGFRTGVPRVSPWSEPRRQGLGAGLGDAALGDASAPPGEFATRSFSSSSSSAIFHASVSVKSFLLCVYGGPPMDAGRGRRVLLPLGVVEALRSDLIDEALVGLEYAPAGLVDMAPGDDALFGFLAGTALGLGMQWACLEPDSVLFSLLAAWAKSGFLESRLMVSLDAVGFFVDGDGDGDGRGSSSVGREAAPFIFGGGGLCLLFWAVVAHARHASLLRVASRLGVTV